jgi:hypothetical protein
LNRRIFICSALVLLSFAPAVSQQNGLQPDWLFATHPLRWQSPPRELHLGIKTAPSDLMVLYPNGSFAGVSCLLIKSSDGHITISRGDGDVVRIGQWQQENAGVLTKSRVVFRTVTVTGRSIPEDETSERFIKQTANRLRNSRSEYRRLRGFSDFAYLDTLIRCDRREWDGHADRKDFVPPCMAPK